MNPFRKHDWHLIDTKVLPSVLDQQRFGGEMSLRFAKMCSRRTLIQTFKCKMTGAAKVVRTVSGQKGTVHL